MPKTKKYYAVRVGREGPKIYDTWDECCHNVSRWPGAIHKSFTSRQKAEDWLRPFTVSSHNTTQLSPANTQPLPSTSTGQPLKSRAISSSSASNAQPRQVAPAAPKPAEISPSSSAPSPISLSPEQHAVLNKVKAGRSVFFTGSAGTGKSVLLREIIRTLGGSASATLGITASTGIAAVNIGGTTLHSWAGIGLGQESPKSIAGKFLGQKKFAPVLQRWRAVRSLIIDEVSMIDGGLFDDLEFIAQKVRNNDAPFGGIQLILSGDFCQLPPVPNTKDGKKMQVLFAFDAKSWNDCVGPPITLTRVFRQKDQAFVDMLNAMRFGELNPKIVEAFKKLSRPVQYDDGLEPTELFPTRAEVAYANRMRLKALKGPELVYTAHDSAGNDSKGEPISREQMNRLLERLVVSQQLTLKVGAQVMLVKNLIQGQLVNGSVGKVIGFETTKDAAQKNIGVLSTEDKAGKPGPPPNEQQWPVVRFANSRTMLCVPTDFTVNNAFGEMEACRSQVPLIHAWALSVHKSQGQTLERVKVDLRRTFEKGQAYVALSRATNMDHLQVLNFDASKVTAHPRVLAWHKGIALTNDMYDEDYVDMEAEMDDEDAIAAYFGTH